MHKELIVLIYLGLVLAGLRMIVWRYRASTSILEGWARQHGYRIVTRQGRALFKGPFFWTATHSQAVYRVTVEDRNGEKRKGWVCCGSVFLGLLSDKTEVQWDR